MIGNGLGDGRVRVSNPQVPQGMVAPDVLVRFKGFPIQRGVQEIAFDWKEIYKTPKRYESLNY